MNPCSHTTSISLVVVWCVWVATLGNVKADSRKLSSPIVVQGFAPSGLRISVPETPGTDLVIINANVNFPISEKETGQVSGSVSRSQDGYWSLEKTDITLKSGDAIFYVVFMATGNTGYNIGGNQVIHELVEYSCRPSPTTVNGRPVCGGQLILDENFDTFNTSIWRQSIQFSDEPDYDFAIYTNDPGNSFVKDGLLHLKATILNEEDLTKHTKLEGCTWFRRGANHCERKPVGWDILPPTRSAMITTRNTFSFKFGRIDIRAKAATGDWLRTRLMLEPQRGVYGNDLYESGRIQLLSARNSPEVAGHNDVQYDMKTCGRSLYFFKDCELPHGRNYSNNFHVFSLRWTPHFLALTYDDICEHKATPRDGGFLKEDYFKDNCHGSMWEKGTKMAPFDHEFYIQMNLAPGGIYVYGDNIPSRGYTKPWTETDPRAMLRFWEKRNVYLPSWTSDMEIDYVKVWSL